MGDGARGDQYCFNDGVDSADGDYAAAAELWRDEYAADGGGTGAGTTVVVLYRSGAAEGSGDTGENATIAAGELGATGATAGGAIDGKERGLDVEGSSGGWGLRRSHYAGGGGGAGDFGAKTADESGVLSLTSSYSFRYVSCLLCDFYE